MAVQRAELRKYRNTHKHIMYELELGTSELSKASRDGDVRRRPYLTPPARVPVALGTCGPSYGECLT